MSKINITIAEPCQEDWEKMQAGSNGRHCASCEKTVVDFTQQPREEIEQYLLENASEKICGRFRSSDIQTAAIAPPPVKVSWFRSRWMAFAAAVSFLGINKKAAAYVFPVVADDPDAETQKLQPKSTQTVVHGWIRSSEDNKGIAKVEIRIYSGGKEIAYSSSFTNGSYFMYIPENTIWDHKITLEYNSVDYQSQILDEIPVMKDRVKLDIVMVGVRDMVRDFGISRVETYTMGGIGMNHVQGMYMEHQVKEERLMGAVSIVREVMIEQLVVDTVEEKIVEEEMPVVEAKTFDIKTYPNPSTGLFNLALENTEGASLMVYDLSGKLVLNKKVFSSLESIDISDQPNGTYLVLVVDEATGLRKQSKVIKM